MMSLEIKPCSYDETALAPKGSKRQIQLVVNNARELVDTVIGEALGGSLALEWVSPLKADRYREYWDSAFLKALGMSRYERELSVFWPNGGPHWDALAKVKTGSGGVMLVEAKSHVDEMYAEGSRAKPESKPLAMIDAAIAQTKTWLNVDSAADWMGKHSYSLNGKPRRGSLYQTANRLAHLYFFREILGINAWLVNVYFIGDPYQPTLRTDWEVGIADAKRALRLGPVPFSADVFLHASA
jgi:hypothetical protein